MQQDNNRPFKKKHFPKKPFHKKPFKEAPAHNPPTSWEPVAQDYNNNVGEKGSYYHQNVVLPGVIRLLDLQPKSSVLDLACGQGVLSRRLSSGVDYYGVDISSSLIEAAQKLNKSMRIKFAVQDITVPFSLGKKDFTHCTIILALQNIEDISAVMDNAARHLAPKGRMLLVLNHPMFRIPKQTSWEIDLKNHRQFRRVNHYLTPLKVPINMTPGAKDKTVLTWSFHYSLADYSAVFREKGFLIEKIEEWASDKTSVGKNANMENHARREIPMFMAILLIKN